MLRIRLSADQEFLLGRCLLIEVDVVSGNLRSREGSKNLSTDYTDFTD
jgi:hypothetical protein